MAYNDGTWTDEKPEVGKRYWKTFWIDEPHNRFANAVATGYTTDVDRALWRQQPLFDELRSVHPIPDPTPPPLPSKEPR